MLLVGGEPLELGREGEEPQGTAEHLVGIIEWKVVEELEEGCLAVVPDLHLSLLHQSFGLAQRQTATQVAVEYESPLYLFSKGHA